MSVTMIKDLAKAVVEQDEHRKALREKEAGAGATGEAQPPAPQPGSAADSSPNET